LVDTFAAQDFDAAFFNDIGTHTRISRSANNVERREYFSRQSIHGKPASYGCSTAAEVLLSRDYSAIPTTKTDSQFDACGTDYPNNVING
jgi:hypothetical protein